jgi:hypothetical protein
MRVPFLFWLDPPILKRSHQKMGLRGEACLERKHIYTAVSNMDDRRLGGKARPRASFGASTHQFPVYSVSVGRLRVSPLGAG